MDIHSYIQQCGWAVNVDHLNNGKYWEQYTPAPRLQIIKSNLDIAETVTTTGGQPLLSDTKIGESSNLWPGRIILPEIQSTLGLWLCGTRAKLQHVVIPLFNGRDGSFWTADGVRPHFLATSQDQSIRNIFQKPSGMSASSTLTCQLRRRGRGELNRAIESLIQLLIDEATVVTRATNALVVFAMNATDMLYWYDVFTAVSTSSGNKPRNIVFASPVRAQGRAFQVAPGPVNRTGEFDHTIELGA